MERERSGLWWKLVAVMVPALLLVSLPAIAFPHQQTWQLDKSFTNWAHSLTTPALTSVMKWISGVALTNAHYWILGAVGLYFLVGRFRVLPTLALLAVRLSAEPLANVLKDAYARPRPQLAWLASQSKSYSYPSGTVVVGAAFYVMLAYVIAQEFENAKWRRAVQACGWVFAGLIAFSRIYLGAHWLTDTVAGLAVACALTAAVSGIAALPFLQLPAFRPLSSAAAAYMKRGRSKQ